MSDYKPHFAPDDYSSKNDYKPSSIENSRDENYKPHFAQEEKEYTPVQKKVVENIITKYATDPEFKRQWDEEHDQRIVKEENPSDFNKGYRVAKTIYNRYSNPINLIKDAKDVYAGGSYDVAKGIYDEAMAPPDNGYFTKGVRDSTLGMLDDVLAGRRGGSGYTPGEKAWTTKVFSDEEAIAQTWNDIKYLTGQSIADIPVLGALAYTVGRVPAIGTATTFGVKSGADEALREYRDTDQIFGKKVAREAVKGFGTGLVFTGAGEGAKRLVKGVAGKVIPDLLKTERVVRNTDRVANIADYVSGGTGMTIASAKLNDQDVQGRDIARNILGGVAVDAGRVASRRNYENKMDAIHDNDSLKSEYVNLIEKSSNEKFNAYDRASKKYIKEVDVPKELRTPDYIAKKAVEKAVDDYYRIKKNLKDIDESHLSTKEKEMFLDPQAESDYLRGVIKSIETKTKGKSGYLAEDGTIIRPEESVSSIKDIDTEISRIRHEENTQPVDTMEAVANMARRTDELLKAREHATDVNLDALKNMKKSHELTDRITKVERYLDAMELQGARRSAMRRALLNDELQGRVAHRVDPEKKEGMIRTWFETAPYKIKSQLGETAQQHVLTPIRTMDAILSEKRRIYSKKINDIAGTFNKQERKEILAYRLSKKHRTNDKGEDVPMGDVLLSKAIERGQLEPKDIKSWDDLSTKQQDAISYMEISEAESFNNFNIMRDATGKERVRESKGYTPIVYKDQMEYADNSNVKLRDLTPTSLDNKFTHKFKGADLDLADPFEAHKLYKNTMERIIHTGPTAKRLEDFADQVQMVNPKGANVIREISKYWSGDFTDPTIGKKFIHKLNQRQYASFLANSIGTIYNQSTALKMTMSEFGVHETFKALESWYESKFNDAEHLKNARYMENSNVIKGAVHDTLADDYNNVTPANRISKASDSLVQKGQWAFKQVDLSAREITQQVAFNHYKKMGYNDIDAAFKADEAVNRTQGSGGRADIAKVHRYAIGKLLLSFQTFRIANLNYIAHDIFGVSPIKKNMKVFRDYGKAVEFAKGNKGYDVQTVHGQTLNSKPRYVVYHKQRTIDTVQAMRKLLIFGVFTAISNSLVDMVSEESGIKFFHEPAPIDKAMEAAYGYKTSDVILDNLFGTHEVQESIKEQRKYRMKDGKRIKISRNERFVDAGVATARELASMFPVIGEVLNEGNPSGSVLGTTTKVGIDVGRFAKSKKWEDGLKAANDASTLLFGNGFYQPVKYFLQYRKTQEMEKKKHKPSGGGSNKFKIKKFDRKIKSIRNRFN